MPVYFYWGDDDYQISQAVKKLIDNSIDPMWRDFNYTKINASGDLEVMDGLNQAVTSPFGMGSRLTWLVDTAIAQKCSESLLAELERTFKNLPNDPTDEYSIAYSWDIYGIGYSKKFVS